jgi:hypothetical protein
MARYLATVESRSPAAETFGYLAAFSIFSMAEWDFGVLARGQLDTGPVGAGSRFRLVVPCAGARMSLTCEVIGFVPDREVVLHAANAVLRSTDRIAVTGAADGSTVSYDAAAGLTDALSRRPPGGGTRTAAAAPDSSGGAAEPAGGRP